MVRQNEVSIEGSVCAGRSCIRQGKIEMQGCNVRPMKYDSKQHGTLLDRQKSEKNEIFSCKFYEFFAFFFSSEINLTSICLFK